MSLRFLGASLLGNLLRVEGKIIASEELSRVSNAAS